MKTTSAIRALIRCRKKDGRIYIRPKRIETAIEIASKQELATLRGRAEIEDPRNGEYLPTECRGYLVREALSARDDQTLNDLTPFLFGRCAVILRSKHGKNRDFQEEIRSRFAELLAEDAGEGTSNELDFFEVRFNRAFKAMRIDLIREEVKRRAVFKPLAEELSEDDDSTAGIGREGVKAQHDTMLAHYKNLLLSGKVHDALAELPFDERKAMILCCIHGYKEESIDPNEVTAAKLCEVSGRTIRTRLQNAMTKLRNIYETNKV